MVKVRKFSSEEIKLRREIIEVKCEKEAIEFKKIGGHISVYDEIKWQEFKKELSKLIKLLELEELT